MVSDDTYPRIGYTYRPPVEDPIAHCEVVKPTAHLFTHTRMHLFDRAPYRWHFRGDPYLWRSLRADLASVPLPTDVWTLERMIRTAFESITGRPLTDNNEPFHVPEFDPGHGMSAGGVTPAWWVSTAIPILIDRFEATLPHEPDGDGLNVPSPAEQPGQED